MDILITIIVITGFIVYGCFIFILGQALGLNEYMDTKWYKEYNNEKPKNTRLEDRRKKIRIKK